MNCLKNYEIDDRLSYSIWGSMIVVMLLGLNLHYIPDIFGFIASLGLILTGIRDRLFVAAWFPLEQVDDPNRE